MTIYFSHPTDSDCVIAVEIGTLTTIDLNLPDDDWDIATDPNIDENSYRLFYVDELEWVMQLPYVKIIFNGFYILTQVRTVTKQPAILPDVERIRKAKKPPEVLVKRFENLQSFQPTVVSFHQEVEIIERGSSLTVGTVLGGWKVHPHFRSGCFTNQPHGQGRSERKRIWRRPSFVNKDRFGGDLANTKVTLTTKGN